MKRIYLILCLLNLALISKSQTESEGVKLDLLKAPASPASNLLGFATSDIDKPTDVSAFMTSLQSASNNFSIIPSNYAVDLAPYWLFKKNLGDNTTEGLKMSKGKNVFKQTFILSFAVRNTDSTEKNFDPNSIYGGFGFKFSIVRGNYDEATKANLDEIHRLQILQTAAQSKTLAEYQREPDVIMLQNLRKQLIKQKFEPTIDIEAKTIIENEIDSITKALESKLEFLKDQTETEAKEKIKSVAESFQTARIGFTWDVSGGVSTQFIDKRFDKSKIYNSGVWTTLGYTWEKFGSALFLARVLTNPDKVFAKDNALNEMGDITTFDFGGRYIFTSPQSKFNASVEGIYRSVLTSNTIDPTWRLVFNADYAIFKNQKLTFSFGKNFDGTITKDGNVIAALTFLSGFGNRR